MKKFNLRKGRSRRRIKKASRNLSGILFNWREQSLQSNVTPVQVEDKLVLFYNRQKAKEFADKYKGVKTVSELFNGTNKMSISEMIKVIESEGVQCTILPEESN